MCRESELLQVLDRLASLKVDGDPTIKSLLTVVPGLREMDWINRFGPASAWGRITSGIPTDVLGWLTKVFVIAEREFDWAGGSVAASIWLYQAYSNRNDVDHPDALADWALRNRGRNEYVPFGGLTAARSLEDWRAEQRARQQRRKVQRVREEEEKRAKIERTQQSMVRAAERRHQSERRRAQIEERVEELRSLDARGRLSLLAADIALPLEAIPSALIAESIPAAGSLDEQTKQALLGRIDRRGGRVWKRLRAALVVDGR